MNVKKDPRRPGKWMIDTTVTMPDQSHVHFQKTGYETKGAAVSDYHSALSNFISGKGFKVKGNFDELADQYLTYFSERVKPSTLVLANSLVDYHIKRFFKGRTLKDVYNTISMERFRSHVTGSRYSQSWKNKILSALLNISEFGFNRNALTPDMYRAAKIYLESIRGQDPIPTRYTIWTKEQYRLFINTFSDHDKYKVLFQWLFFSGTRIGETLALQWKDFDFSNMRIWVAKTANSRLGTGKAEILTTKTKAGVRYVYLNEEMNAQLLNLKETYGQKLEAFIFFGGSEPVGYTSVKRKFLIHTRKAGLPVLKIHEIRHTNNTWLLDDHQSRAEADIITKRLGRSSLKVTLDTYYHSNPEIELDIVKKIKI